MDKVPIVSLGCGENTQHLSEFDSQVHIPEVTLSVDSRQIYRLGQRLLLSEIALLQLSKGNAESCQKLYLIGHNLL